MRHLLTAMRTLLALIPLLAGVLPAAAEPHLGSPWPEVAPYGGETGTRVSFASSSPFTLSEVGAPDVPQTQAQATLYLPEEAGADDPVPAVILLHGAAGVLGSRERTYARQYAEMGVAALVIDVFAARRDMASGFINRLLNITEAMFLADAYAGLDYLAKRPEVDGSRVALIGFSYGGMVTTYAAYAQVAKAYAPDGRRFAAHVAYYAPCIAEFEDTRATGAPLLMLSGAKDAIVDTARCGEVAADLTQSGADVTQIVYAEAYHQWDGRFSGPRPIGRDLSACRFVVETDGTVRGYWSAIEMTGPFTRKLLLWLCTPDEGYLIGRDDAIRARSNAAVGRFLEEALVGTDAPS